MLTLIFLRQPCKKLVWLNSLPSTLIWFASDPKTVHICGERNVLSISSGSKGQVTVITCVSATGQAILPFIIWKWKTMAPEMAIEEIPGTHYGFSVSRWRNSSIFNSWFQKLFLRYTPASRPLILFMDRHSSHYCPALAHENGIFIFTLPPNTTHRLLLSWYIQITDFSREFKFY